MLAVIRAIRVSREIARIWPRIQGAQFNMLSRLYRQFCISKLQSNGSGLVLQDEQAPGGIHQGHDTLHRNRVDFHRVPEVLFQKLLDVLPISGICGAYPHHSHKHQAEQPK